MLKPTTNFHIATHVERLVGRHLYERDLWKDGQDEGLPWSPVRGPEENVGEAHWAQRETFLQVDYPELGKTLTQVGAKWVAPGPSVADRPRARLFLESMTPSFWPMTGVRKAPAVRAPEKACSGAASA